MKSWVTVGGLAAILAFSGARPVGAQEKADSLEAINADFEKGYKALETTKLERLAKLAASQPKDQANATYELLFHTAIGAGMYAEAEPFAKQVLKAKTYNAPTGWLAVFVAMLGEAKRGAFEDSLATLDSVIHANQEAKANEPENRLNVVVPEAQRITLIDAYYQILVQADQFEIARKAMALIQKKTESNAIKRMVTNRLKQLELVGKAAPAIQAADLDGKPVKLEELKGHPVLLAFWTTWSLTSAEELDWFQRVAREKYDQGLRVITINVDAMEEGVNPSAITSGIHKFALDHHFRWPVIVDKPGPASIAAHYGVSEIPSSVLIGKDGKVAHLDLRRSNLEKFVAQELAR